MGTWDLGLGTWGRKMRNLGTSSMGHQDMWDGDMRRKYRDAGDMGTFIAKVGGKYDISFFVKMCYLSSTLTSIVQNHIGHLMIFTQNISLYRGKRTDYCD